MEQLLEEEEVAHVEEVKDLQLLKEYNLES
jgi:hypothetical protein